MSSERCRKCRWEGTRAHHRRCERRGNRAQAREAMTMWAEAYASALLDGKTDIAEPWRRRRSKSARFMAGDGVFVATALADACRKVFEETKRVVDSIDLSRATKDDLHLAAQLFGVGPATPSPPAEVWGNLDAALADLGVDGPPLSGAVEVTAVESGSDLTGLL